MIPASTYRAKALDAVVSQTKKGNPYVVVMYEVLTGEFSGTKLTWSGFFTEKTTERTKEALRVSNVDLAELLSGGKYLVDAPSEVDLVVIQEPVLDQNNKPTGRMRNRVNWVNSPGMGGGPKPLDEDGRRELAMILNVDVKAPKKADVPF